MTSTPQEKPITRTRAALCLFLNVVVFPGLGTLISGDPSFKRTGMIQFGLGALLTPLLLLFGAGGLMLGGADPEVVKAWLLNFILILVIWNVVTGLKIFRKAWKQAKFHESPKAS